MGRIIGIDLGTTNTVVSVLKDGELVVVNTSEGISYIPSVVCYDSRDDVFNVGRMARDFMTHEPDNAVYSVKRLMGMHYSDEHDRQQHENLANRMTFLELKRWLGYRLGSAPDGKDEGVRVVLGKDGKDGKDKYYTPEDISAMILKRA